MDSSHPHSTSFTVDERPPVAKIPHDIFNKLHEESKPLTKEDIDAKLTAAEIRRTTHEAEISERAKAEVDHARAIASAMIEVEQKTHDDQLKALNEKLALADDRRHIIEKERVEKLEKLESHVKTMKDQVSSAESELAELEARLAAAEERRKALEDAKIAKARRMSQGHIGTE